MQSFDPSVEKAIHAALNAAKADGLDAAEVAHIFLSILEVPDARTLVETVIEGPSVDDFHRRLGAMIRSDAPAPATNSQASQNASKGFQRIIQRAALATQKEGREAVTGADIMQSIILAWRELPGDVAQFVYSSGLTHLRIAAARKGMALPPIGPMPKPKATTPTPANPAPRRSAILQNNPNNPLSIKATTLNGHVNYVDPPIGVSFPSPADPDPVTQLNWIGRGKGGSLTQKKAILSVGKDTCHFCGLKAGKYMEVVGPSSATTMDRMRVACIFCAQVSALDVVPSQRSGVLLLLPEFGQAELNAYARIIYVCRNSQGAPAAVAKLALAHLMKRREAARKKIRTDDPHDLAAMFAGCKTQEERHALLAQISDIRVFPLDRRIITEGDLEFNQFPQILTYWRSKDGPFGGLTPTKMDLRQFEAKMAGITA